MAEFDNFDNVAFVWGENISNGPLTTSPSVTVSLWPEVLGCASLRWKQGHMPDLTPHDVILVNLFHTPDSIHIAEIKAAYPHKTVIAMPDPSLDVVLNAPEYVERMLPQMVQADIIGGRTEYDCAVYGALLQKPTVHLPSPAGPVEFFSQYHTVEKDDYILTQDHTFAPNTALNVTTLALIQRATGIRVVYAAALAHTRTLADIAGLKAEFHPHIPWMDFIELTARARLSIDVYTLHSYHRHAILCYLLKTPVLTGGWTGHNPGLDCYDPITIADYAINIIQNPGAYSVDHRYALAVSRYGFGASRDRVRGILEGIRAGAYA